MRVIGTAGHVDHGKSTLVEALSGTHPDRLKEEREREMTIDLGFAWLTLPNGEDLGIIDVPGHRDFIENMLAGVGGIDAVLFVIAADEGVMPQTREHLAILDLLQIQGGVVALTKVDLVPDSDWLDLVEEDVSLVLVDTILENAPIVRVSAKTGAGIPQLLHEIQVCLQGRPPRPDLGRPRLPIDRIFSMAGFGTVVTGTLSDGQLRIGDELELLPAGLKGRVRGLQTHKQKEDVAVPGSRTAVNITGISVEQLQRGDVVAHPGDYRPSGRLDARFMLLKDISAPLQHNTEVKLFIGASEVVARVRILGVEELLPGSEGWLQLELAQPVVALRGDHYILRRPSPGETLGGGAITDPHPKGRHKRFAPDILARLESLSKGTPADILLQALLASGPAPLKDVISRSTLDDAAIKEAIQELTAARQLVFLEMAPDAASAALAMGAPAPKDTLVIGRFAWEQLVSRAAQEVDNYHTAFPLRRGMPREELKSRLTLTPRLYNALIRQMTSQGEIQEAGPILHRPAHQIHFTPQQQHRIDELMKRFAAAPYAPPTMKESQAEIGEDVVNALVELGQLVSVSPDVVFKRATYDQMVLELKKIIQANGSVTAAQVRDHFNTSRRYVLALLEYLDATGITVRNGDIRRLK